MPFLSLIVQNGYPQCDSEFHDNVVRFSHRMTKPLLSYNYQQYYDWWGKKVHPYINLNNFIENDLNISQKNYVHTITNNELSGFDSLKSNYYSMLHNSSIDKKYHSMVVIFLQKKDTLPLLISSFLVKDTSYGIRQLCARLLKFYSFDDAYSSLKILTDDPCLFVRLDAALSLSYIGEKAVSYNTFINIWDMKDPRININQFMYFTEGMRNIGDETAITFLTTLLSTENPYCATDASICLLQLNRKEDCLYGLRIILKQNNVDLFYTSAMVLFNYFASEIVRSEIEPYLQSTNRDIAGFSNFIINNLLKDKK